MKIENMSSISSSEAISIIGDTPICFSSGVYALYGQTVHKRIQGHLQRSSGAVFTGFEGKSIIPADLIDDRLAVLEPSCKANIGNGVMVSAQLDAVFDRQVSLEIKSGNAKEAGLRWLQLALNSMVWSLDKEEEVLGRLMYFYNTDHLYYLPGDGREYWTYLSTLAWMACQIRDREESIAQIAKSYNRSVVTGKGQRKFFVAGREETEESNQYCEYLGRENFNQGKVVKDIKHRAILRIMAEVKAVE